MIFTVYILRTSSNTLYIGQTNNLEKRLQLHQFDKNKGAKYVRYFQSFELVYSENFATRSEAMRREAEIKKWTKAKKEALVAGNRELLKGL
jgi:putative endonuclease